MITRTDPVIFSLTQRKASRKARFFLCQLMTTVLLPEVGRRCSSCP